MTDGLQAPEGMEWALGNVELDTLPWEGPFDFIVFSEVLEHLNFRAEPTLVALASVLAPEGRIYLSTPDSAEWGVTTKYYDSYDELPLPSEADRDNVVDDHIWQFSRDELMAVITAAGLEVVRFAYAPGTHGRHFNLAAQLTD